jgi:hypothetical protein
MSLFCSPLFPFPKSHLCFVCSINIIVDINCVVVDNKSVENPSLIFFRVPIFLSLVFCSLPFLHSLGPSRQRGGTKKIQRGTKRYYPYFFFISYNKLTIFDICIINIVPF